MNPLCIFRYHSAFANNCCICNISYIPTVHIIRVDLPFRSFYQECRLDRAGELGFASPFRPNSKWADANLMGISPSGPSIFDDMGRRDWFMSDIPLSKRKSALQHLLSCSYSCSSLLPLLILPSFVLSAIDVSTPSLKSMARRWKQKTWTQSPLRRLCKHLSCTSSLS